MEYERLVLEVGANRAGLKPVAPRVLKGGSGIDHQVSMLFSDGSRFYGFDFYDSVTEIEVVRSYAKKFDTGANVNIVCLGGEVSDKARTLAREYDMRVLTPKGAATFFVPQTAPHTLAGN